jgi:hypothetical protein
MGGANPEQHIPTEDAPEGGGGVSEAAREQLAEEIRKASAQQKRDVKDEKRAKKKDNKLADIIRAFIHSNDDRMSLLISRLIQKNVPVTFVLGILSLNYDEINELLEKHLSFEEKTTKELILSKEQNLPQLFSDEVMRKIDEWGNRLFQNASINPMKHLVTLAQATGVDLSAIQLTSFMIQEFMEKNGLKKEFAEIQGFSDFLLKGILQKLHDLADEQGILPPPEMGESDDEDDDDEDEE